MKMNNVIKKILVGASVIGVVMLIFFLLTGCADVSNVKTCLLPTEYTYGFFGGVWHGMTAQFAFIGSLFSDEIAIYAINNNGAWYNFGYVGGLGIMVKLFLFIIKQFK